MRPLCVCKQRPAAVNYKKDGRTYYRKKCEICLRHNGIAIGIPAWQRAGYEMKTSCDKCGFSSKHPEQFNVYHIDGDLNNCKHNNLKTICANCQRIMQKAGVRWKQGDLIPDF